MESPKYDIYVVGMRVEKCIGVEAIEDGLYHNNDTGPCESERYILFCKATPFQNFTITLWEDGGWCGSGYCTATFGNKLIKNVDTFGPATHRPKNGKPIKLEHAYYDPDEGVCFEKVVDQYGEIREYYDAEIMNNVFVYSEYGDDEYYPCGYVRIHKQLFEKYIRAFQKRPVWIFVGDSASGKSSLAYYLHNDKEVLETDSLDNGILPREIWADIIVIGNKYDISTQNVLDKLPDETEPIIVNFSKMNEESNE